MALDLFWNWTSLGVTWLLNLVGILALILPGRYVPRDAHRFGLGRHVEALVLVSFAVTLTVGSFGHVPVWIGEGGIVAVSLLGAVVPALLALHFLLCAGLVRLLLSLVPLYAVAIVCYLITEPVEGLGIVARPPWYYLPAVVAGLGGLAVGGRSLRAVPLAFAYGSLGALIGADLARWGWITSRDFGAASIGGAQAMDLVFLLGLWGAAVAFVPLAAHYLAMRRTKPGWEPVASGALDGRARASLLAAEAHVEAALAFWAREHDREGWPRDALLAETSARPVIEQIHALLSTPEPWDPMQLRRTLENAEGLTNRLSVPVLRDAAPAGRRVAAGALDLIPVLLIVGAAVALAVGSFPLDSADRRTRVQAVIGLVIYTLWVLGAGHVLVPLAMEWASGGRSLGKALLGLRVRRVDGRRVGGWDHIARNLARLLDMLALYIIPLVARAERGRQRVGDHFAGTYVASASVATPTVTTAPAMQPASATRPSHDAMRPPL